MGKEAEWLDKLTREVAGHIFIINMLEKFINEYKQSVIEAMEKQENPDYRIILQGKAESIEHIANILEQLKGLTQVEYK